MKVGRNEPCPCGSGKKYKHCCLAKEEAESPEELAWRRVRRAIDGLASALLRTANARFGPTALDEAWEEFNLWEADEPFDYETPYLQVFMPWFLYHWLPEPEETEVPVEAHGEVAARVHLRTAGKRLDPLAARYIEAALGVPFSFHEVLACTPGRSIRLRDVLIGTEAEVMEASASKHVEAGDLLYAKVVPIEGIAMLEGCSPVALPPVAKPEILAAREKRALSHAFPRRGVRRGPRRRALLPLGQGAHRRRARRPGERHRQPRGPLSRTPRLARTRCREPVPCRA
jgi:hypothetical protein